MSGNQTTSKDSLLQALGYEDAQLSRDVEDALRQVFLVPHIDRDRVTAFIQDPTLEQWLTEAGFGALLVHGNSRRHEVVSPISMACGIIIHLFKNTITRHRMPIITIYWFCGSHTTGSNGGALGLVRSLICQLLAAGPFDQGFKQTKNFESQDLENLLDVFTKLLKQIPEESAVVCVLDGISFYEDSQLRDDTIEVIRKLVKLSSIEEPIFKLLVTSPIRTAYLHKEPGIEKYTTVVEIPQHVNGAKQGLNDEIFASTEHRVRRLSKSLPAHYEKE